MSAGSRADAALILLDMHAAIVGWHGDPGAAAVRAAAQALAAARRAGLHVFHVLPRYRPGYPEIPGGEPFDAVRAGGLFREADAAAAVPAELVPRADEPVVAKFRYSPFFANDLLMMLGMRGVRSLALAGLATSGVVLSAIRDAWDRDFRITVLADACADPDPEVHRLLIEKVFPPQAAIRTVAQWSAQLRTDAVEGQR
ncbi:MAG: cysteine hydrolase [Gammaproteobacteria bacterium]